MRLSLATDTHRRFQRQQQQQQRGGDATQGGVAIYSARQPASPVAAFTLGVTRAACVRYISKGKLRIIRSSR